MTTIDILENRISTVQKYLRILQKYKKYSETEIINDLDLKGAFERYLYLVCQSAIDLAETVISYKKFRKPSTMSESFVILQEEDIIPIELLEKLIRMVGFRNVIAHGYENLDYNKAYQILQDDLKDIKEFVKIISTFMNTEAL